LESDGRPVSTLHDYLRVLRRRKWIVIPAVILAPLVSVLLSRGEPVKYEASAQALVSRQNLPANLTGVSDPTQVDSSRLLTTQAEFARLPEIAQRALSAAGLQNRSPSDLLGASRVTSTDNSDFLTFTVSDAFPARSIRLANAYARQYIAYRREFDSSQLASARQSVLERIQELEDAGATKSPLYASLVEKVDQLATMEAVAASSQGLVRPATGAARLPSHVVRNGLFAFVLALIAAVGLAFLRDALDTRMRSADEIGGRLRLRLLGRLPRPPHALRKANRLVMLGEPESPYAEPFRMLRTSLEFVAARQPVEPGVGSNLLPLRPAARSAHRVMVTSAVEGEGKSTTVANLAVAFAQAGRKVLLVDLDFRRASLHHFFGLQSQPGLTDVVLGEVALSEVVSYVGLDPSGSVEGTTGRRAADRSAGGSPGGSLGVVPLGSLPPHAGDVAFTVGIEPVLEQLASDADLVLIDSPPLLRVGDALALTSYVDALLVVASLGVIRATMLDELRRVLADCPAPKLGFILTGADLEGGYEYLTYPYQRTG
jgi:polysaccharide biosynthesis transport protein